MLVLCGCGFRRDVQQQNITARPETGKFGASKCHFTQNREAAVSEDRDGNKKTPRVRVVSVFQSNNSAPF